MTYADYEWFVKYDLTRYKGKWVAIVNEEVVAYGDSASSVINEVKFKYPKKRPFITKVRSTLAIL